MKNIKLTFLGLLLSVSVFAQTTGNVAILNNPFAQPIPLTNGTTGQILYTTGTAVGWENAPAGGVTNIATGTGLTGGPIITTGTVAIANTAVTAGSYTTPNITVNAQGQLTAASNNSSQISSANEVAFGGNSICAGFPFFFNNYPYYATLNYLGAWVDTNTGVPGSTVGTMLSFQIPVINADSKVSVVVMEGGINDVLASTSAAVIDTAIQQMATSLFAHGKEVIWINIMPANNLTSGELAIRHSVNAWEATSAFKHVTYKISGDVLGSLSNIDSLRQQYISSNGSPHISTSGATTFGNYIYANSIFTSSITLTSNLYVYGSVSISESFGPTQNILVSSITTIPGTNGLTLSGGFGNGSNGGIGGGANSAGGGFLTTGSNNWWVGPYALCLNTTGSDNIASGYGALYSNTSGSDNAATGYESMYDNTTGGTNTADGFGSLFGNTTGSNNTADGYQALEGNQTGSNNTAVGVNSLAGNTVSNITGYGYGAGGQQTSGLGNTYIGYDAGADNQTGQYNTFVGFETGYFNTGNSCTGMGWSAGYHNTGVGNTYAGMTAFYTNSAGTYCTANGFQSLYNTTGSNNTGYGANSLLTNTSGSNNTALGYGADVSSGALTNATSIGYNAVATVSNEAITGNSSLLYFVLGGGAYCDPIQVSSATSGTVASNGAETLELTGSLATVVLTDPASPLSGQNWKITTTQASTTISFTNTGHFYSASLPTTVKNIGGHEFEYDGTKWLTLY